MDDFLFELAQMKYRMYQELHKIKPYAATSDECFKRIELKARYEQVLNVINMLPIDQSRELSKIEKTYFQ